MKKGIFFVLALFTYINLEAQPNITRGFITAGFENLISTHNTHFYGMGISMGLQVSKRLGIGVGTEFSYSQWHADNGWDLYHLKFLPIYAEQYFYFGRWPKFRPFVHLREGLSFIKYSKELQERRGTIVKVSENGFYGFGAIGADTRLSNKLGVLMEAGMKAYHISSNIMEVNPHGFCGRLGIRVLLD